MKAITNPRGVLDALTEAALERDQALFADWWAKLDERGYAPAIEAATSAFRRGYAAAWHGGAIERVLPGKGRQP